MKTESERLLSVRVLQKILQHKGSLSSIKANNTGYDDKLNSALIQEYCYGVCRHFHELAFISSTVMEKPLRKKDSDIYCLILIGLYQLLYMRTPEHAAINETVAEVTLLRKPWAKGLVNAVLRQAQRQSAELQIKINADFSHKFSHPDWLISAFKQSWPADYQQILLANNQRAPMTLRLNLSQQSRQQYLQHLSEQSIQATAGSLAETSILLEQAVPVQSLPGFSDGLVSVQDEASQLAATLLKLQPGQRVLDACSAPGGKTCGILENEPAIAELISLDSDARRLERVSENLDRTKLKATLLCADLNDIEQWWDGHKFDRILLDVPCSGTGVIRRHPDIKVLRQAKDIAELITKQSKILRSVWPLLEQDGLLLYSTCSTLPGENTEQISNFIEQTDNASHVELDQTWGHKCNFGRQLLPGTGNHDGFYYALLQKC